MIVGVFVIILVWIALWFLIIGGCTWIVQFAVTSWTGDAVPFWPVFWLLLVLVALVNISASTALRSNKK